MPETLVRLTCLALIGAAFSLGASARGDARFFALLDVSERPLPPSPVPPGLAGIDARSCAGCHDEVAAEWERSRHHVAFTNDVFQASLALEPRESCVRCHAPSAPEGSPMGREAGVDCAACHVRDGEILGTGTSASHAPHPVRVVAQLGTSRFCASCHEFDFPSDVVGGDAEGFATHEPMQRTYDEWLASDAARSGAECQSCHMPRRRGHASHEFLGGHDLATLQRAVHVEARATRSEGGVDVVATVVPDAIGHSFPTGDLFRRAELRVEIEGDPSSVHTFGLARTFRDSIERGPRGGRVLVRREVADTRVAPPGLGAPQPIAVRFEGAPEGARIRYTLSHLLMPTPMAASQGLGEARVRTMIATGLVPIAEGGNP